MNDDIKRYIDVIRYCCDDLMDLVILYDCSKNQINVEEYPEYKFHIFNSDNLDGFWYDGDEKLPVTLIALFDFYKKNSYYHYLVIESDIVLNGHFTNFLKRINEDNDVDYIHIATDIPEGSPYNHWPIKYVEKYGNPFKKLYFAWQVMYYISDNYLKAVEKWMETNNMFFEFLLPSLAYNSNGEFIVKQFENYSYHFEVAWNPKEYEKKYKNNRQLRTFYHPIKDLSIVDFKIMLE